MAPSSVHNEDDEDDDNAFGQTGALTIKSSFGSSGGLIAALGMHDYHYETPQQAGNPGGGVLHPAPVNHKQPIPAGSSESKQPARQDIYAKQSSKTGSRQVDDSTPPPTDLDSLLTDLGLTKYITVFAEQDVDLQLFLTLTDNDLKEIGITLVTRLMCCSYTC